MPETVEQFAARIKAKYPQYQGVPDAELTQRIITKYPQYRSAVQLAQPGMLRQVGETALDVAKGTGKGVMSTGLGVAKLIGTVPKETTLTDIGMEPEGTAQKIGFGGEQVGEFFLPGGMVARGAKGIAALKGAPKFAPWVARAALEAASAAGVTAAQTGGDVKATETAAALGGAIPIAGKAISPIAQPLKAYLSRKLPARLINSLLKPPKKQFMFGKDPGGEVSRMGLKANSLEGLQTEIAKKKSFVGQQIDQILSVRGNQAKRVSITRPVSEPIDEAIRFHQTTTGNQGAITALENMKEALLETRFPGMKNVRLSPMEATKLKREIGEAMKWSDDPVEATLNDVRQKIFGNLKDEINTAVPEVRLPNRQYSNLLSADKSAQLRVDMASKLNLLGLTSAGLATGAALLTAALGGDLSDSALVAIAAGGFTKGLVSTPVMSRFASALAKLPPQDRTIISTKLVPLVRNLFLASQSHSAENQ